MRETIRIIRLKIAIITGVRISTITKGIIKRIKTKIIRETRVAIILITITIVKITTIIRVIQIRSKAITIVMKITIRKQNMNNNESNKINSDNAMKSN